MIELMVNWASQPATAVFVLAGAVVVILVEATRQGRTALWGDFFYDEMDDE
ncbi:MAG: hypothetical protein AAFO57_09805 [Pseudomonadota bacterium]